MNTTTSPGWWRVLSLTALVYAATAALALQLTFAAGYAAPLYPPAGIALALAWIYGRPALFGVGLGAFAVNLVLASMHTGATPAALGVALAVGVGATLQAWVGCALLRRVVGEPLVLARPRDEHHFLLFGAVLA
jgi:integral membrane sensor domain MASE1